MAESRNDRLNFILEIGCEEIPAPMVPQALEDLSSGLLKALGELASEARTSLEYGGPRRLVASIEGILRKEEDRTETVHGPSRAAAYDPEGKPTRAAEGFARKHGLEVKDLTVAETKKGEVLAATREIPGRSAAEVLAGSVPELLRRMRFRKMMRWGDRGYLFVRPVHWILALLDDQVVPFEFMGVSSGRSTRGHRFLGPGPHQVSSSGEFAGVLLEKGKIEVRHAERRRILMDSADKAAGESGGRLRMDDELLEEWSFLTEHPAIIAGSFPEKFLSLPEEVLFTAMRHHQKYLTVEDESGRMKNAFIGVLTTDPDPEGLIRRGNEWVLKARLADARFFHDEDQKLPLRDRVKALSGVTFHARLGSYADKADRVVKILEGLVSDLGISGPAAEELLEAARLSKADLTTGMVGEFPELQGVIGGIYARLQGHGEICAQAIEEHYLPAGPGDGVPSPGPASALALADKLDTLALCFSAGMIPRGSADPYALRRSALGVLRILIENGIDLDLSGPLRAALDHAAPMARAAAAAIASGKGRGKAPPADPLGALAEFLSQRLRFLMEEDGVRFDAARAAIAAGWSRPLKAWRRARALNLLRGQEDFLALAASAKRVRNILSQAGEKGINFASGSVKADLLRETAESDLHRRMAEVGREAGELAARDDHGGALSAIAAIRPAVDRFFDDVLVMDKDDGIRRNRLCLLADLSSLLSREADFAEVVVEGEAAEPAS